MTILYFDNSVLHPIASQSAGGRVKSLLKRHRAIAFGSIQNLIEFFRIEPDDQRAQRIRTLLQVARTRETEPVLYRDIRALVNELGRHHLDWINPRPDLTATMKDLADAKLVWERLKIDPQHRPPGFLRHREYVKGSIGESMRRQRYLGPTPPAGTALSKAVLNADIDARFRPLFDALPVPEGHWREHMALAYWSALDGSGDELVSNLKDWLGPHLFFERVDFELWMQFWLVELDEAFLPRTRVEGLTGYFQVKVEPGNAGDIEHSGYAVGSDYLLTADKGLHRILTLVEQQPGTKMARPLLVDRASPDIVAAITSALGWSTRG